MKAYPLGITSRRWTLSDNVHYRPILTSLIARKASEFGIEAHEWTVERLRRRLKAEVNILLSANHVKELIAYLGYRSEPVVMPLPLLLCTPRTASEVEGWMEAFL